MRRRKMKKLKVRGRRRRKVREKKVPKKRRPMGLLRNVLPRRRRKLNQKSRRQRAANRQKLKQKPKNSSLSPLSQLRPQGQPDRVEAVLSITIYISCEAITPKSCNITQPDIWRMCFCEMLFILCGGFPGSTACTYVFAGQIQSTSPTVLADRSVQTPHAAMPWGGGCEK